MTAAQSPKLVTPEKKKYPVPVQIECASDEQEVAHGYGCVLSAAQSQPEHQSGREIRQCSACLDQTGTEGARPRYRREHTGLCPGQQSRETVPHALMEDVSQNACHDADRANREDVIGTCG
jgi:hypothetical protein